jgi:hypothetical protein
VLVLLPVIETEPFMRKAVDHEHEQEHDYEKKR